MDKELYKYSPVGAKYCEGQCVRNIIMTEKGPVIVCDGCYRIVMDNRKK